MKKKQSCVCCFLDENKDSRKEPSFWLSSPASPFFIASKTYNSQLLKYLKSSKLSHSQILLNNFQKLTLHFEYLNLPFDCQ